jgi:hypothetical protein
MHWSMGGTLANGQTIAHVWQMLLTASMCSLLSMENTQVMSSLPEEALVSSPMVRVLEWDFVSLNSAIWTRLDTSPRISLKVMLQVLAGHKSVSTIMQLQTMIRPRLLSLRVEP